MIFDTHCHLYDDKYIEGSIDAIKLSINNGVSLMMIPGDNLENSIKAVELSKLFKEVYCSVGIHPQEVDSIELDKALIELEKLVLSNNKIKAIGEIGIDKYWNKDEQVILKQKEYFIKQIELANNLKLPIIVHDREAHEEVLNILKEHKPIFGCVIHCFSGSVELMKEFIKMGFYIGLDGPVTYKNAIVPKEVAKLVPLDKLLIETDSPYLPPVPKRGQVNYPHYLRFVIDEIAKIKGIVPREIEDTTYNNGIKFFGVNVDE